MGLTKSSFGTSDSQVTHYDNKWNQKSSGSFVANWGRYAQLPPYSWEDGETSRSCVAITTDAAGVANLSFTISNREGWEYQSTSEGTLYFAITSTKSVPGSGTAATLSGSSPCARGTFPSASAKLLPNRTYYVWFWGSGHLWSYKGTLTFTATGTYGAPGAITANNADFDSPVNMSYASATAGGAYTVVVQVGSSAAETLQTQSNAGSRVWTPSLATYAASYPNQSSVNAVITVYTYFGGVYAGSATKTITLYFTAAQVGPSTANAFSIAPYNAGAIAGMTGYIQGYSRIRASFASGNVTLRSGATISKWSVKFGAAAAVDVAAGTATKDSGTVSAVTTVVCTVTDSRGFTASETYETTITPYENPALTATLTRTDANGNADDAGTYLRVDLAGWYSDIEGQNTQTSDVKKKLRSAADFDTPVTVTGGTTTQTGTRKIYTVANFLISGMTDAVYDVQATITDALGNTAVIAVVIASQKWALHIRNGGEGAAFGKAAERDNELDIGDWKLTCGAISSHILVELAAFSSLPKTVYHDSITAAHVVTRHELGTPSAQTGNWTVTTAAGSLTISGSISGTTTLRLLLEIPGTTVTG